MQYEYYTCTQIAQCYLHLQYIVNMISLCAVESGWEVSMCRAVMGDRSCWAIGD